MHSPSPTIPLRSVERLFLRELDTLREEIEAYPNEESLWQVVPGIANPGGTLALHLCGNLQHFIGARLGNSGYVRDRPAEFASRQVPRNLIVQQIQQTRRVVLETLATLGASELQAEFPESVGGVTPNTAAFVVHLVSHLAFHLGQIDYHRRLTTGGGPIRGALAVLAQTTTSD